MGSLVIFRSMTIHLGEIVSNILVFVRGGRCYFIESIPGISDLCLEELFMKKKINSIRTPTPEFLIWLAQDGSR